MENGSAFEVTLQAIARYVAISLDGIAVLIVVIGAVEAVFGLIAMTLSKRPTGMTKRAVWIRFAQWLIAALTFQLAGRHRVYNGHADLE